ncbi:MAG: LptF/LptG family permease [Kiritimatiellae bacterium]|nr:LptF/LptG family permease [Kiritimatiellia bacterium]
MLRTFLAPLGYCLAGFIIIYIVYDLFDHAADFVDAKTPTLYIAKFYLFLIPSVLIYIVPISLLLAVLYSLYQLTRHNELTAMRASGVSLYRLMVPFVFAGILGSISVAIISESIGPWSAYWTTEFIQSQKQQNRLNLHIINDLTFNNTQDKRNWVINNFNKNTYHMEGVRIIQQNQDGSETYLQAKTGRWLDAHWWFSDLAIQHFDQDGSAIGRTTYKNKATEMLDLTEVPRDFLTEIKKPEFLSSFELMNYLKTHKHLSKKALASKWVDFHHRVATPWACLIVTLIGIPFGNQTGRKGTLWGFILCFSLFFGYYLLIHLSLFLGKTEVLIPWFAAWGPNVICLMMASILIYRMR